MITPSTPPAVTVTVTVTVYGNFDIILEAFYFYFVLYANPQLAVLSAVPTRVEC